MTSKSYSSSAAYTHVNTIVLTKYNYSSFRVTTCVHAYTTEIVCTTADNKEHSVQTLGVLCQYECMSVCVSKLCHEHDKERQDKEVDVSMRTQNYVYA